MGNLDQIQAEIKVRVLPRSAENRILRTHEGVFKVKLNAPPVEGRANKALIGFLSKKLGVPKGKVEILTGKRTRLKTVRIQGISLSDVQRRLD
jgi:uncharacterized protein (TIGR00251 family)